jgi:phage gpG-like protein
MIRTQLNLSDTATPAIRRLVDWANDLSPMMHDLSVGFESLARLSFIAGTDPYKNKWTALSPVTIAKRRKQSSVIGRDTSRLFNSILAVSSSNKSGVETNVVYARTFHYGAKQGQYGKSKRNSPIPWGDIPARNLFPLAALPQDWDDEIDRVTSNYAQAAWNG